MPTDHIVALLVTERDKLNRAIEALSPTERRGRPAKALASAIPPKARKKVLWTPAKKRAQAAKMKAYWAKKRKG
jgi:hypothetical protein